MMKTRSLIT
ncbi:hypothetical protein HU200_011701 [Digitaria exilis]|uniref:Uncharacterized protein n=1 Tax=Digitaria exilis TaxID=1010633 RepID=A0A835KQB2_9POAL|nr:hypothetical protein HU200_011701 [Digitaria exilis]